jgi:hypothetical protein
LKLRRERAKTKTERDAHQRGECALRDHPTLSRYLRQTKTGRLLIDRDKLAAEERLDGKYLLTTSHPRLSAEDVALGYKQLLEAERSFRDLKGTLLLRPVFHRKDERIRAHVLICFLALVIIRVAETAPTGHGARSEPSSARSAKATSAHATASSPKPANSPNTSASSTPRSPSPSRRTSGASPPPDAPPQPVGTRAQAAQSPESPVFTTDSGPYAPLPRAEVRTTHR